MWGFIWSITENDMKNERLIILDAALNLDGCLLK